MFARLQRCVRHCVFLVLAGPALAQTAANIGPDRVTFFSEPDFQGEALMVEAGASVENLDRVLRSDRQPWMFSISSVRVEGAAKAFVFTNTGFAGERLEITRSIPDLLPVKRGRDAGSTWDRAVASINVTGPVRAAGSLPASSARLAPVTGPVYVVPAPGRATATTIAAQNAAPRLDQRSAELIVQRVYRDVLNRSVDPEGLRTYRDRLMNDGWTERQLVEHLQKSGEARATNPDDAIRSIYRETLGRDPDPKGLAHYRTKWREGWTQGQIRDDLRKSNEGRDSNPRIAITRAYAELLGREPDPAGYANYERLMREKGFTERDVRDAIMRGDEYRKKRGLR